jgi:hypothetical protein
VSVALSGRAALALADLVAGLPLALTLLLRLLL